MLFSVFYQHILRAAADNALTVDKALSQFHKHGVAAAEFDVAQLINDPDIPARLNASGMTISSVYGHCPFATDPKSDAGFRLVDAAASAGSRLVMPLPGLYVPDISDAQVRENITVGLAHMVDYAAKGGICVTIEDFDDPRSPINSSSGMLYFGVQIPELYYTYDTGNFYGSEDLHAAFCSIQSKIRHVHGKDVTATPIFTENGNPSISGQPRYAAPFGLGDVDTRGVIADLRSIDYEGFITAEFFGIRDYASAILDSAKWFQENCF